MPLELSNRIDIRWFRYFRWSASALALARALLTDAPVLILDEATNLDILTEKDYWQPFGVGQDHHFHCPSIDHCGAIWKVFVWTRVKSWSKGRMKSWLLRMVFLIWWIVRKEKEDGRTLLRVPNFITVDILAFLCAWFYRLSSCWFCGLILLFAKKKSLLLQVLLHWT